MADGTPIWKRQLHLRKRSGSAAPTPAATLADAMRSIWRRELRPVDTNMADEAAADAWPQPIVEQAPQPIVEQVPQPIVEPAPEPTFDEPPLWDSPAPDPPFVRREVLPAAHGRDLIDPDPVGGAPWQGATSSDAPPERALDTSQQLPEWGVSVGEDAPSAPDARHPGEPEWVGEGERASLDDAALESDTDGRYEWTESTDERWEVVISPPTTTGWAESDEQRQATGPDLASPPPPEPDAGSEAETPFSLTPEASTWSESEPVSTRWWDSEPAEIETFDPDEPDARLVSVEPEQIHTPAGPSQWQRPATLPWRPAETEPVAPDQELESAVPPAGRAEQDEPAGPVDWMQTHPEAASLAEEPELEQPTLQQGEAPLPTSGWEYAPPAPEAPAAAEPENAAPDEEPVAHTTALVPKGPKPSLLKRELRFPRPRSRAPKQGSVKASNPHAIKNIVGLRVGSSQLAAAYVHNNGTHELVQIARTPLARGIVTGGEVRDPEALTGALKKFFSEHKLPRRGIRLGIASNRIGVRLLEVPVIDDPRLFENSIRFHAQETLPISVSDAIIDHVVLGAGTNDGLQPTVRILLVFAHRELVDRHVQACRRAGLKLEGIDFEAFALLRALGAPRPAETEATRAVVAVAIGQERTIFAVSDGRICDFTRVLEWGGGSLDVAVARALNLTPSQAEPLKLALSLDGDAAPSQLTPEHAEAARAATRTELQSLSRELVSSLQFYQARPGSLDIGEIMLSGGGGQLAGLAAELERLVGVPVVAGDPFARVEVGRKVGRPAELGSLAVAIGLGIED